MQEVSIDAAFFAAHVVAAQSTCLDKRVGCVLLDEQENLLTLGTNHACPASALGTCLKKEGQPCPAVHAEQDAVHALSIWLGEKTPVYACCTLEPCAKCTSELIGAGIKEVWYENDTNPEKSGKALAEANGVKWIKRPVPEKTVCISDAINEVREYHRELKYPVEEAQAIDIVSPEKNTTMLELLNGLEAEVAELRDSWDWKPWKKYGGVRGINMDNFLEEAGDILFFIDSLLMAVGASWEDLAKRMLAKVEEDKKRITNGYHN